MLSFGRAETYGDVAGTAARTRRKRAVRMQPTKTDPDAVRDDWALRGFTCELWIDPPQQVATFEHDVDALVLLLDGSCVIEFDGGAVRMGAGDQLAIPAGRRHTVRNCGEGPARWLHGFPASAA